jgi:hypothetical protein
VHLKIIVAALAAPLLAGACSTQPGTPSPVAAPPVADSMPGVVNITGAYRHDRFGRNARDLGACVAHALSQAHPDFVLDLQGGRPPILTASRQGSDLWLLEFHPVGAGLTEGLLRARGGTQPDFEEAWNAVEDCARQGS